MIPINHFSLKVSDGYTIVDANDMEMAESIGNAEEAHHSLIDKAPSDLHSAENEFGRNSGCMCTQYWCCFLPFCVREARVGIVESCGRYERVLPPGLHWLNWPFESIPLGGMVSLKVQQLDVTCEAKTRDNVFVSVKLAVIYKANAERIVDAYYKLADHRQQIGSFVTDGIRSAFPKLDIDECYASKGSVSRSVKSRLVAQMTDYGYVIMDCLITDIDPSRALKAAMNDINSSQRLREASVYKADAEKILRVKAAEASSESKGLVGVGVAKQQRVLLDGIRTSLTSFSDTVHDCSSDDVMNLLLQTQYFDTLRAVGDPRNGSTANTLFIPHAPGTVSQLRAATTQTVP